PMPTEIRNDHAVAGREVLDLSAEEASAAHHPVDEHQRLARALVHDLERNAVDGVHAQARSSWSSTAACTISQRRSTCSCAVVVWPTETRMKLRPSMTEGVTYASPESLIARARASVASLPFRWRKETSAKETGATSSMRGSASIRRANISARRICSRWWWRMPRAP